MVNSKLSPKEVQKRLDKILLKVQKPGRYVGGEYNEIIKEWDKTATKVALVFPDIYDLGISNLGISILYEQLNQLEDVLAERVYSPWIDMEEQMRKNEIPLFALESKHPLADFDLVGFTLPYETLYTNTLNILDLAGIPLRAKDRDENYPLIIAGGHAAFNPEPMAAFIDAFVIGDGEEVIQEIIFHHQKWKKSAGTRQELLVNLSTISGVYVPSLYEPEYKEDFTLSGIKKLHPQAPDKVQKRFLPKLPDPPTHIIVPSINVVHDRIAIEIMRGCTRGCRFCHAGFITRPVRERSVDEIIETIKVSLENTGYEEIALLSLSSSDYTNIFELVDRINSEFEGKNLKISLPSLRIETVSVDILDQLKTSRPGGFTLAPEAATDRMRGIINKPIQSEMLLETAREIYKRGWPTIKLYFMIGHPSETIEDVEAIAELCKAVLAEGKKTIGRRAKLNAGVSTFIPKAHTPFQWVPSDNEEIIREKQDVLRRELRAPGLKLNWTDPRDTLLEGFLSRGDRRLSEVIFEAWKAGTKFDAWQDQVDYGAWDFAFHKLGLSPDFYTSRLRSEDEIFPWDHIHSGVKKEYLLEEYQNSKKGILRDDCRNGCFACGILPIYSELRRQYSGDYWKCP